MKRLPIFVVALLFVASIASAQGTTTKTKAAGKALTHPVAAEVVSTDATAKTITLKVGDKTVTMPVQGKAIAALANLKVGEAVTATCKDNAKGEHLAITNVKAAKPKK